MLFKEPARNRERATHCGMPYFELDEGWRDNLHGLIERGLPGVLTNLDSEPAYGAYLYVLENILEISVLLVRIPGPS